MWKIYTMKQIKIKTDTVVNNYFNEETGEITNQEINVKHHKIIIADKESFALQYSEIIGKMKNLNGNDIKLLAYCSLNAEHNTNRIALTKPICEEIFEGLEIPYQSIRNSAAKLVKEKVLIPLGSATYRVNPKYYWRGNSNERLKTMKYILEIECPDCF